MANLITKPEPFSWRYMPRAPLPGTRLMAFSDIKNGTAKDFTFGRGTTVFSMFIVRQDDKVYGYLNICPHYSQPLNYREGQFLNEDATRIRCTMHFAEFNIDDGFGVAGAAENCWLDPVPVIVKDEGIFIATPEEVEAHD